MPDDSDPVEPLTEDDELLLGALIGVALLTDLLGPGRSLPVLDWPNLLVAPEELS